MIEIIFLFILALTWVIFATVQDLKTREIANWLNFSLIVFALAFRFFYSLFFAGNFEFFYQGLLGFGIFFVIGNIFYYGRLFAGGDAKLLIALGTILPLSTSFSSNLEIFFFFIIIFLVVGAIYGIFVSIILCIKNYKKFKKEFKKQVQKNKKVIYSLLVAGIIFIALGFFDSLFAILGVISFLFSYFYPYVKAVDETAMVKMINPGRLREGDWLYSDVKIDKKTVNATWDGLSRQDIALLRKRKKDVKIREGIAFTPVFLITLVVFFYLWANGLGYPFW